MNVFTVCAFAIATGIVLSVLKTLKPEMATLGSIVAGVLIIVYILEGLTPIIEFIKNCLYETNTESYFTLMVKSLAISFCCKTSAEICRDCKENTLASRVELAGKIGIVIVSLPAVAQLLEMAKDMMK